MADKRVQDLPAATSVGSADRFVLEQSGAAKSLTGQVLINDLAAALDGHGGIASITYTAPVSPSLSGTLTITLADGTSETLSVTNGRGITGISKSSSGLTDTYTLAYNDGTTSTFSVDNGKEIVSVEKTDTDVLTDTYTISYNDGTDDEFSVENGRGIDDIEWATSGTAGDGMTHTGTIYYNDDTTSTIIFNDGVKGDTGAQTYVWFKWAATYPTQDSDMQNSVAPYIGIYAGTSETAPTDYTAYSWYQYKGDKGDTGDTGDYIDPIVSFGTSTAAATEPQTWYSSPTSISYSAGNFIWQKTQYTLHNAQTVQSTEKKIIGYIGQNGSGSGTVTQVTFNGTSFQDDGTGNVSITVDAEDVGAIPEPANKANGQVLTYDSSADEWVAATPTTGAVNTVNNVGVTAGTTNIQIYGTDVPMSSSDNTSVKDAIPLASSSTPQPLGTAAAGSGTTWARADHVHAKPSRTDLGLGAVAEENVVPIAEGGTGATSAGDALSNLGAYDLGSSTSIPSNADLDTYKTVGTYRTSSSSVAASLQHSPTTTSFKMIVEYTASTSYIRQTIIDYKGENSWVRWYNSSWSAWVKTSAPLPLSIANGGTGATTVDDAVDNLGLSRLKKLELIAAGNANVATIRIATTLGYCPVLLITNGPGTSRQGLYIIAIRKTLNANITTIQAASALTITTAAGYIQLSSTDSYTYAYLLPLGSDVVDSLTITTVT